MSTNSLFDEQLMVSLISHVKTGHESLAGLKSQLGLTLFSIMTPFTIQSVDNHVGSNPNIIAEAVALKEYADVLGMFYGVERFSDKIVDLVVSARSRDNKIFEKEQVLHPQLMAEYFSSPKGMEEFLHANPVFVGLYIYLLCSM